MTPIFKSLGIGLALLLALPAHAISEIFRDERGDLRLKDPAFADLDILQVKVSTSDRKTFVFEIKTKGVPVSTPENPIYFVLAVNEDGDFYTGKSMWISGPEVSRFIYLEGSSVSKVSKQWPDDNPLGEAVLENDTLRVTLTLDTQKAKFIGFGAHVILKRPRPDGKGSYTILDAATAKPPKNETYQFNI